ncbi:BPSS1187 family protein [Candidatus Cyanaurora vandensis]|uniref:beta strand repeat-containing protein n=1 Tax=Candidatus Cyanaurora vandensis TaxID=2714958 RepID=UPI00257B76DB|nr:IPT/TIG domain-containing protein [Candidatus Cyanaurora vandensis]
MNTTKQIFKKTLSVLALGLVGWLWSVTAVLAQTAVCPAQTTDHQEIEGGIMCVIQPSLTDSRIDDQGEFNGGFGYHVVAIPNTNSKGTFLYLLGTGGTPYDPDNQDYQAKNVIQEAVAKGYLAIVLAYANGNGGTIGDLCAAQPGTRNCTGYAHQEIIYGEDVSTVVSVDEPNSVMYRLDALHDFLKANLPTTFAFPAALSGPEINWPQMRLGGHSQGGGNAGTIAQDLRVQQLCYFASPADYLESRNSVSSVAWIEDIFITPTSLMRGVVHVNDDYYAGIAVNYDTLGMIQSTNETAPNNSWVALTQAVSNPHGAVVTEEQFSYARTWACFEDAPLVLAKVLQVSPRAAPLGAQVTITGTNLESTRHVYFNGLEVPFIINSNTQLTATVETLENTGLVSVYTRQGGMVSTDLSFTVSPVVTSLTPTTGPVGTITTITGTGFMGTTGVRFNGVAVPFTVVSDSQLTARITSGTNTGTLSVTTAAGTAETNLKFKVLAALTGFTPDSGPVGTVITLTGTGFTEAIKVSVGLVDVSSFTINSDTRITATVAPETPAGFVRVTIPVGIATASVEKFTVITAPKITSFSPAAGLVGTVVTVKGSDFVGTTQVLLNGAPTSFDVRSSTSIGMTVPTGATTGRITVINAAGSATSTTNFQVYPKPVVTSFTPTTGPVGTQMTITGSGFTGATDVSVGYEAVSSFQVNSDTRITATISPGIDQGLIRVTNPVTTGTSADSFTVIQPPVLNSFSPLVGIVGTTVKLNGAELGTTTRVTFNGVTATFTITSGTQVQAVVPVGATTGTITLTNPAGSVTSTMSFGVYAVPVISEFSPTTGPVGTVVTITGSGFNGTTGVTFARNAVRSFTVNSNTKITATVADDTNTGSIRVSNPVGTAVSAEEFTVIDPPTLTSVNPTAGLVGDTVTLAGTNLGTTTRVTFNGVSATFTINSSTRVKAVVPVGATTGPVVLTNPGGNATLPSFGVYPLPVVTSFTPTSGPVGTVVTITGSGFTGADQVSFGYDDAASFTVNSDTQVTATVAVGTPTGLVRVYNPAAAGVSSTSFTVK